MNPTSWKVDIYLHVMCMCSYQCFKNLKKLWKLKNLRATYQPTTRNRKSNKLLVPLNRKSKAPEFGGGAGIWGDGKNWIPTAAPKGLEELVGIWGNAAVTTKIHAKIKSQMIELIFSIFVRSTKFLWNIPTSSLCLVTLLQELGVSWAE